MKAFKVTMPYYYDIVCIYAAETASKARHCVKKEIESANYENVKYGDIRVIRAPEFDNYAANCEKTNLIGWKEKEYSKDGYGVFKVVE